MSQPLWALGLEITGALFGALPWSIVGFYYLVIEKDENGRAEIRKDGPKMMVVLMYVALIYGALTRDRLMFLAGFPVAILAGHGFAETMKRIHGNNTWSEIKQKFV